MYRSEAVDFDTSVNRFMFHEFPVVCGASKIIRFAIDVLLVRVSWQYTVTCSTAARPFVGQYTFKLTLESKVLNMLQLSKKKTIEY